MHNRQRGVYSEDELAPFRCRLEPIVDTDAAPGEPPGAIAGAAPGGRSGLPDGGGGVTGVRRPVEETIDGAGEAAVVKDTLVEGAESGPSSLSEMTFTSCAPLGSASTDVEDAFVDVLGLSDGWAE